VPSHSKMIPCLVAILLGIHAAILLDSARKNFVTPDEVGHLAAGISHWETSTYSMYRVNPPMPRSLAVLPVILEQPNIEGIQPDDVPGHRAEAESGRQFAADNQDRYFHLVWLARLAGIGWSLVGGWLIYRWASELYGWLAGCLGLALWCFEPNVLGHAPLITPDVPATVASLAATYAFWHFLRKPSWGRAVLAGSLLGTALLTKFTLLVLCGVLPLLWFLHRWTEPDIRFSSLFQSRSLLQGLLIFGISLFVINLGYEFHRTCHPLGSIPFVSRSFTGDLPPGETSGNRFQDSLLGRVPVPVPADFLRGIDVQRCEFETRYRPSYLAGEIRYGGWWYYYLYGLAVKVPLGVWGLVLWSLVLTLIRHRSSPNWFDEAILWLPVVVILGVVSSQTGFNRHLRYVLPIFPFVIISTSKLSYFFQVGYRKVGVLVLVLLSWAIGSSLSIHPHYLSYFNEVVGGLDNGQNHLLNSNIDWGQDLLYLKAWLDQHPEARPLFVAYANNVSPRLAGIKEFDMPPRGPTGAPTGGAEKAAQAGPLPGFYAVSVNFIRGAPYWACDRHDQLYYIDEHYYDYFRHFQPIAKAGYSIFIYHITPEEANAVRRRLGLSELPEKTPMQ
jgi:Dolichyl-phosphate-mannose-protein mannosyltransferase